MMKHEFKIPLNSPSIGKKDEKAVIDVLHSGWPSEGKVTQEFEQRLSEYLSAEVVTVNNGSSALMASLIANNFKPGDKVVVPSFSFIASSSIPKMLGAKVLVSDIDQDTLNMDPRRVEEIVKKHDVKFVIPVDIGGLSINVDFFRDLAKRYNFKLIEDAAQAFGSQYKNKMQVVYFNC